MLPVTWNGKRFGEITLRPNGLYAQCDAVCKLQTEGVPRLWLVGQTRLYLGVLAPEGEHWTLHRRIPLRRISQENWQCGELETGSEPWQLFSGTVAGFFVENGLCRCCNGRREVAIPFDPSAPFAYLPLLPRLRVAVIAGKPWLVMHDLDESGAS